MASLVTPPLRRGVHSLIDLNNSNGCSVDVANLKRQYGIEQTRTLLQLFVSENQERMVELKKGLRMRSAPVVSMVAHSLKGVSGMLQAHKLQQLASNIETAVKDGNWTRVDELAGYLELELKLVSERFSAEKLI